MGFLAWVHRPIIGEEWLSAWLVTIQLVERVLAIVVVGWVDWGRWVRVPWRDTSIDIDRLINPY